MHLLNLTLSRPSAIQVAVYGNFSAPKVQEVVVAKGNVLELLRPDDTGRMQPVCSVPVFGQLRSLQKFRMAGDPFDHVVVGSDSGRLVVLRFDKDRGVFRKVHQETFGKTGCRRIVPGQFVATDPRGRAIMVGALEKQKFTYVMNRDTDGNMTISSPLEAHKTSHLCFDLVGLDCGYDNPVFAAIEIDYSEVDDDPTGQAAMQAQKVLTYYELDLGLNHVTRKSAVTVDNGANLLLAVPGGTDGPGGCLVCCENFVLYRNLDNQGELRAVIPRRSSLPGHRGVLLVSGTSHRTKSTFFFLLQSEYGDLYRITLEYTAETATELKIKYFDSIPTCTSIAVLRSGFLFAASEFGNHTLYQFQGLGDDDAAEASSSAAVEVEEGYALVYFEPRELTNLAPIDEVESLAPIVDLVAGNLSGDSTGAPQLYALCGRGARSSLRVLRSGLSVTQIAEQTLPGVPTAVWSIRRAMTDEYDGYLVLSFTNATLVLAIGEAIVEATDTGIENTVPTLAMQLLEDSSIVQVHPNAVRVIRPDRRANEWATPRRRAIQQTATNTRQVAIAVSGGEIYYFELDMQLGQLLAIEEGKCSVGSDVACLAIPAVPEGRQRSRFLAMGTFDSKVTILSLEMESIMEKLAVLGTHRPPESLLFVDQAIGAAQGTGALFLNVGTDDGVLIRSGVDRQTGALSDQRQRFLGTRKPKLVAARINGQPAVLALSSRPWLGYNDMGRYTLAPLSFGALDHAAAFSSESCPEGFVAVSEDKLRVLMMERLSGAFNQQVVPLRYTPRHAIVHPSTKLLIVCESDKQAVPLEERTDLVPPDAMEGVEVKPMAPEESEEARAREEQFGAPKGSPRQWASCVRILDPSSGQTLFCQEIGPSHAVLSACLCTFAARPEDGPMLVVGCARSLSFDPLASEGGVLHVFRFTQGGRTLELLHSTDTKEEVVGALCPFQGRLLAGLGNTLRLYDIGRKKLLRKCENRGLPTSIREIRVLGERIFAADNQESVHLLKYRKSDNVMSVLADDTLPRYVTCTAVLDYDTIAVADKFGNVNVLRLPPDVSRRIEGDPSSGKALEGVSWLNGAPHKFEAVASFHVGDPVMALVRTTLAPGGSEVLLYATVAGQIGCFLPLATREEADFFTMLEMHLRQELPPLCGRDHMAYRSYHFVIKDCVDGDLVELYGLLPSDVQAQIAAALDQQGIRSPGDVFKRIEDVRAKVV